MMISEPRKLQNFLIVSGNGRNTGKTSFVCKLIESVSKLQPITAIKISPHFHADDKTAVLIKEKHFIIRKENNLAGKKDTARMIRAGASQVYYLEVLDNHLSEAFNALINITDLSGPVICESGGLRKIIEPSMFILLNRDDGRETKAGFINLSPLADKIVLFDGNEFDFLPENFLFENGRWVIT